MFELKSTANLTQSLALTPELKQALKILALGDQELEELTKEELTNNAALEEREDEIEAFSFDYARSNNSVSIDTPYWEELGSHTPSLWEDLSEQLSESTFNIVEKEIGARLIHDVDEKGYFSGSVQEIAFELSVPETWIESVRKRMLFFEPIGCLATNLNECIMAQALCAKPPPNPILLRVLSENLLETAILNPKPVAKQIGCSSSDLCNALAGLSRFSRHPGKAFEEQDAPILSTSPQVEVRCVSGDFQVVSLKSFRSHLWVDRKLITKGPRVDDQVAAYVKHNTQRALSFLKALSRREQTIVKVVETITKHQNGWFLCTEPLSPLTMKQVASDLGIHESTVSRAVANKYLRCDRGTFSIRSFFVSQLPSSSDKVHSSDAIKETILRLIAKEDSRRPLSDGQICHILCQNQLFVARRTIAKYRAQLKIPIRSQRKTVH